MAQTTQLSQKTDSPTDTELLIARVRADEAQVEYMQMILKRAQAEKRELANWWAAYIGLPGN